MFCDLVDSTGLAARLDPEDFLQVIQEYRNACVAGSERYHGKVARYLGDGVMVYFGYPRAHEEDAERAVRAALRLAAAMKALKIRLADGTLIGVSIRIGIASGLVVVGRTANPGAAMEETVAGETLNLAARLQTLARPGAVVVSTATRELVKNRCRLENLGEHSLPGFDKPQALWRIVAAGCAGTGLHARRERAPDALVGRRTEFRQLLEQWKLAQQHNGRAVLLSGEAGVGKSMLLETLRAYIARQSFEHYSYRCSPLHGNVVPHSLIADLAAVTRPRLVILEDVHREAAAALEICNRLAPQLWDKPVLLVLSHRSDFTPPAAWLSRRRVEKIALGPLTPAAASLLINRILSAEQTSPHLVDWIASRSDGIPFFLEELAMAAQSARRNNEVAPVPAPPEEVAVPAALQVALMARLDQHPTAIEVAQHGAALGRRFSYALLAKTWQRRQQALDVSLHALCGAGLLLKAGAADNPCYTFKWMLLREVAYQSMLKCARQKLHGRIVQVLAQHYAECGRQQPGLLAYHCARARRPQRPPGNGRERRSGFNHVQPGETGSGKGLYNIP